MGHLVGLGEIGNCEIRSKRKRKIHDYSKLQAGRENTELVKNREIDEIDIKDEPLENIAAMRELGKKALQNLSSI